MTAPDTVFLDRDGTLNVKAEEGDYVRSWEQFDFLPGAVEAVRLLTAHGVRIVVVTNQRGVALGRMSEDDLSEIHRRMLDELAAAGGRVARIYHCPHEAGTCDCRKPEIGMFLQAQRDFPEIRFDRAAVIGDSRSDMLAARRIGAAAVFLGEPAALGDVDGTRREASVLDAARWIVGDGA